VRGFLRTSVIATAALAAALAAFLILTLPPPAVALDGRVPGTFAPGAYHIHTVRSDGTGTVDEIAAAAARAGLRFLVFTDHGDGTRSPDPPAYRHGVLCLDAVEISTMDGHLVALGLPAPAPYPLAGRARDVMADVHRMGGTAVAAHPDSPKPDLRWQAQGAAYDGIEWINADSEWRDEEPVDLAAAGLRALVRPAESIATLFARPGRTLRRWDTAARSRPVFGLAAVDAHARISWREDEEPRRRTTLARPSYESMFETLVQTVVLDTALSGEAGEDGARVLGALTSGRSFSIVRALAWPASLEFSASGGDRTVQMGHRLAEVDVPPAGLRFDAAVPQAPGARLTLWRDGVQIATGQGDLSHRATGRQSGVYRIEVSFPGGLVPWIVSNPIVVGDVPGPGGGPGGAPQPDPSEWYEVSVDTRWDIEKDPSSSGSQVSEGDEVSLEYALGPGVPSGQYAALVAPVEAPAGVDRVSFVGRADRPTRLAVQVRLAGQQEGRRWRHSVYLDSAARPITIRLQEFEPAEGSTSQRPVVAPLQSLLFVLDTVNTAPGTGGRVWLSNVRLGVDRLEE
jgi:hypothetical protein